MFWRGKMKELTKQQIEVVFGIIFILIFGLFLVGCQPNIISKNYVVHYDLLELYNCEQLKDACTIGFPLKTTATYHIIYSNGTEVYYDGEFEYNMYNACQYFYPDNCLIKIN